jgi:hypothetical protein
VEFSSKAAKFLVLCANKIFGRNWSEYEVSDQKEDQNEDQNMEYSDTKDFEYVMPSRQCTSNWLKSSYNLNLKYVTEQVLVPKRKEKLFSAVWMIQ